MACPSMDESIECESGSDESKSTISGGESNSCACCIFRGIPGKARCVAARAPPIKRECHIWQFARFPNICYI